RTGREQERNDSHGCADRLKNTSCCEELPRVRALKRKQPKTQWHDQRRGKQQQEVDERQVGDQRRKDRAHGRRLSEITTRAKLGTAIAQPNNIARAAAIHKNETMSRFCIIPLARNRKSPTTSAAWAMASARPLGNRRVAPNQKPSPSASRPSSAYCPTRSNSGFPSGSLAREGAVIAIPLPREAGDGNDDRARTRSAGRVRRDARGPSR